MSAFRMATVLLAVWVTRGMRPIHVTGVQWSTQTWKETSGSSRPTGPEPTSWAQAAGKADWPQWSPDGGAIGFSLNNRLWEISSSGSNPHPLLPGWHASSTASGGHWTPDGELLVFTSHESTAVADQIWAIDPRSRVLRQPPAEPVQLTTGPTSWSVPFPSRDGKKVPLLRRHLARRAFPHRPGNQRNQAAFSEASPPITCPSQGMVSS